MGINERVRGGKEFSTFLHHDHFDVDDIENSIEPKYSTLQASKLPLLFKIGNRLVLPNGQEISTA